MSAPSRVNSDDNISCSQPNISTSTPITNRRASPDSPDDHPATEKQEKRQIRQRNSILIISSTISFMVASIVSHMFSERIGMILLRTSGLVRASNTLSVIVIQRLIYTVTTELINISLNLLRSCLHNPRCLRPVESTVMTIFLTGGLFGNDVG
jgi:hypothetical protein